MNTNIDGDLNDATGMQRAARTEGRTEAYWTTRNALVDAAKAAAPKGDRKWVAYSERTAEEQAQFDAYAAKLAELDAFDALHGGAPIL